MRYWITIFCTQHNTTYARVSENFRGIINDFKPFFLTKLGKRKKKMKLKIILSGINPAQVSIIWDSLQMYKEFKGTFCGARHNARRYWRRNKLPRGLRKTITFLIQASSQKALNCSCSVLKHLFTPSLYIQWRVSLHAEGHLAQFFSSLLRGGNICTRKEAHSYV